MPFKLNFISGLPRSGSTLLSALLMQNPRFHAGMSGPMGTLFTGLLAQMSGSNEFAVFVDETQKRAILKGAFENYYAARWCPARPRRRRSHSPRRQLHRMLRRRIGHHGRRLGNTAPPPASRPATRWRRALLPSAAR